MRELTQEQMVKEEKLFEEYWQGRGLPEEFKSEFFSMWKSRAEIEPFEDIEQPTDHTQLSREEIAVFLKLRGTLELTNSELWDVLNVAEHRIRRLNSELESAKKGIIKEYPLFNMVNPIAVFDFHVDNEKVTFESKEHKELVWRFFTHGMCVTNRDISTNELVYSKSNLVKNALKDANSLLDSIKEDLLKINAEGPANAAKLATNALHAIEIYLKK